MEGQGARLTQRRDQVEFCGHEPYPCDGGVWSGGVADEAAERLGRAREEELERDPASQGLFISKGSFSERPMIC